VYTANKSKYNKLFIGLLKAIIIIAALTFIAYKLWLDTNWNELNEFWQTTWLTSNKQLFLVLAVVLVAINWGMETLKWHRLINKIERFTLLRSLKATLAGITASVFTPNRSGDFAGKMLYVNAHNRIKAIVIAMVCSIAQLLITTTIGSIALIAFIQARYADQLSVHLSYILLGGTMLLIALAYLFYYQLPLLKKILKPFLKKWRSIRKAIAILDLFSSKDYTLVLGFSLMRFSTYCVQYFLLLEFFQSGLSAPEYLTLIPVNFLGITAIPSIALAELGVREAIALSFFSATKAPAIAIISATFVLWIINVAIPALIGTIFIATAPIKTNHD